MMLVLALLCCSLGSDTVPSFSASKRGSPMAISDVRGHVTADHKQGMLLWPVLSGFASRLSPSPEVAFKSHFLVATEAQLQMCFHCIGSPYVCRVQLVNFCLMTTAFILHI